MKEYKVYAIKEGTAIDHIPAGMGMKIVELLGIHKDGIVTIGMNFESNKMGLKDIVKVENKKLTRDEFSKIALLAPNATINIIHDAGVVEKMKLEPPEIVYNVVKCPNPVCITTLEPIDSKFYVKRGARLLLQCHYCEKVNDVSNVSILGIKS